MDSQDFENSQVFEKLEQFIGIIEDEPTKEKLNSDTYNFFKTGYEFISDRLKITIPIIANEADLNNLVSELTNAINQFNNYIGNGNEGHLNNSKGHLQSCITRARNLPTPLSNSDFDFSKAIANFENIAKEKIDNLSNEKEQLSSQVSTITEDLETKSQELDKLSKLLSQKETEIENLNSSFKTEYQNIRDSEKQNYEQDRETFRTEIDNEKKEYREEIDELKDEINSEKGKVMKSLDEKLNEAKKIVNVIGNIGATGNFQNIANSHKRYANAWRIIAIIFMTILSGLLIFTIWDMSSGSYDWTKSLIRIIGAAALSYPATYASQESSKHRKQENYNRRIESELASINPFIELLDEAKKKEIKEKLVEKYFGNNHDSNEKKDDIDIPVSTFEKIVKTLGALIKK